MVTHRFVQELLDRKLLFFDVSAETSSPDLSGRRTFSPDKSGRKVRP